MDRQTLIFGFNHEVVLKEFILFATRELGTIKMNEIIKKVNTSGKVSKFLLEARRINARLGSDDFLECIHASSSFTFSKAETISIAAITLLIKWNHEIGIPNDLSDDVYLNKRLFSILDKCEGYKAHINSAPNFFERYYNQIEKIFTLSVLDSTTSIVNTEIYFDTTLCDAIKSGVKKEFRVIDNLDGININPGLWTFKGSEQGRFAKLFNNSLEITRLIECPFQLKSIVKVYDNINPSKVHSEIKIRSCYLQKIKDVNDYDVRNEGYTEYHERINKLLEFDPTMDAELFFFRENWIEKIGREKFNDNIWLWVFVIELEFESTLTKTVKSLELTPEALAELAKSPF
jgi:hypothetical protein